jgi:hypothetical protein
LLSGHDLSQYVEVIAVLDQFDYKKKRGAIEGAVKTNLKAVLPKGYRFRIMHHESRSSFGLQIADYCCWAIYRKWSRNDPRSYRYIQTRIENEFDLFGTGNDG